jgi:hypothetical protein
VPDIEATVDSLIAAGIPMERYDGNDGPKTDARGIAGKTTEGGSRGSVTRTAISSPSCRCLAAEPDRWAPDDRAPTITVKLEKPRWTGPWKS